MNSLNEAQRRHLLSELGHADKLLSDIESVLTASASRAAFPKYKPDLSPRQVKVIQDYVARLRTQMVRVLEGCDLRHPEPPFGSLHSIRTALTFLDIAFEEVRPKYMRGYGAVPESAAPELNGLADELQGTVARLEAYLAGGLGADLGARLERLAQAGADTELLARLEQIISEHSLVEFRAVLSMILDRLENGALEIAVFGRVSSGKSSLLNRMVGTAVLPVGVTPITAVPTRIVYGAVPAVKVWFADRPAEQCGLDRLAEFVSEHQNPGNARHVTKIVAELPSPQLCEGVVYVDTPGLGSLAAAGAAETRAYLPRCDFGVVLIDSGSALTPEDLATIQALYEAGVPASVLLSKADLLTPEDRQRAMDYTSAHITSELGLELRVWPVSVIGRAELLEDWLEREIRPLYRRHRDLASESLRRKAGALREAVESALRAKLERASQVSEAETAAWKKIEVRLRQAAGRVEETRQRCEGLANEIAHLTADVLAAAASLLLTRRETVPEDGVDTALVHAASQRTNAIRAALESLAQDLSRALEGAAEALASAPPAPGVDLEHVIREMPRLDWCKTCVRVRPSLLALVNKHWEIRRLQSKMRAQIGPRLEAALSSYRHVLTAWSRRSIEDLQRRFDAQAELYRSHLV